MGLRRRVGNGPVALDSATFIYTIEEHPAYEPQLRPLFAAIEDGALRAVTSAVTLLEVLVVPYRIRNFELATEYEVLLTRSRGVRLVPMTDPLLRLAASVRAQYGLRTPDALQAAAGLAESCSALVTNDRRWPEVIGSMKIVQLAPAQPPFTPSPAD